MSRIYLAVFILLSVLVMPATALAQDIYVRDSSNKLVEAKLPPKTVVLTFDDGPSSYTPDILSILKQKNVKATFFVVGSQAVAHPLLKQIYADGHEIGNHTYTHADPSKMPAWRMKLELNLTRLVITSQIDHSTRLFRPPLLGSGGLPPSMQPVVERASELGYVTVGEAIDSEDWQRPGVARIVANATSGTGGVILLHDGGGDRHPTVQALPAIIDYYQSRGFTFATVSGALKLQPQDVMPPLSTTEKLLALLTSVALVVLGWIDAAWRWLIVVLVVASVSRFLIVTIAALIQSRRTVRYRDVDQRSCSVLVPAYNEAAVIVSCLTSVLASRYPHFEVLVIDDGSKDNTFELAAGINDERLRVLQKPNGGKAAALNYGIAKASYDFLIAIDADTVFQPDTISTLMRHFGNPKVGAVSGNTKIVNRHKLITKLQSLEYIVGFNLDRRMGDLFDCITVVPGAIGAFRRAAIEKAGGFAVDTLAEDTDLTIAIKEAGYKITYDAKAIAYTEAPATVRDLLKQRFRWTFGTMQAAWKHKRSFLNPKQGTLGMIGLPYLLLFQIIFPLFAPFFDLALLVGLITHQYELILISFIVYALADIITSAIALRLDNEKLRNLWIIIPQRILYRQLMYYVIAKSCINVLKGRLVHWGKLQREGTHLAKGV